MCDVTSTPEVKESESTLASSEVGGRRRKMIARIWRGVVREADKDIYYEHLKKTGLEEYAATPGNRGVYTLRRLADAKCEFLLLPLWDSGDGIKEFAGSDDEKAVYYPEDEMFLLAKEPTVTHYELMQG